VPHRRTYLLVTCGLACLAFATIFTHRGAALAQSRLPVGGSLKVMVLKACQTCTLPAAPAPCQSTHFHQDQAAAWTPGTPIRIVAASIPEQTEISIYTDIEISTSPQMYMTAGHIFRTKYAGPGVLQSPPCSASYAGSNITTTNIAFPSGYGIDIAAGTPIYVHMDIINWSPISIYPMAQDSYLYYVETGGSE
jgi:hypothetical protein